MAPARVRAPGPTCAAGRMPRTRPRRRHQLPFTAIRELTRVATPATEHAWRAAAIGKNVRQIEELVAGHERGDGPGDPKKPELRLQTLSLALRPEIVARLRQFQRTLGQES